jgi:hypothetical protein
METRILEIPMEKQRQEEIIKLLTEKGAIQPCPRCLNPQFELLGESSVPLQPDVTPPWAGTLQVPVILVACKRCGFITQHAQKVLDQKAPQKFYTEP